MTSTDEYINPIADEDGHILALSELAAEESGIFDSNRNRHTRATRSCMEDCENVKKRNNQTICSVSTLPWHAPLVTRGFEAHGTTSEGIGSAVSERKGRGTWQTLSEPM